MEKVSREIAGPALSRINSVIILAQAVPSVLLGIPCLALRVPSGTTSERKRRPQPYWGGEKSGNALETSNALHYRAFGDPSRTLEGNSRKRSESVSEVFPDILGSVSGRKDFSRILFLGRRIFSRILSPDSSPHFCGKKCPEKSSRKIPGKILQN